MKLRYLWDRYEVVDSRGNIVMRGIFLIFFLRISNEFVIIYAIECFVFLDFYKLKLICPFSSGLCIALSSLIWESIFKHVNSRIYYLKYILIIFAKANSASEHLGDINSK